MKSSKSFIYITNFILQNFDFTVRAQLLHDLHFAPMDQLISLMAGLSQEYVDCIKWSFFFGFLHVTVPQLFNAFQHEWWSGLKGNRVLSCPCNLAIPMR
jgi:hypothetical protein